MSGAAENRWLRAWGSGIACMLALCLTGCGTGPVLAFQGARHYAAGTDALERGDATQAVVRLENAARLVPHASEIQNHLGLAYWSAGQVDQARDAFEHALALDCDNQSAKANLDRVSQVPEQKPYGQGTPDPDHRGQRATEEADDERG